MIGWQKDKVNGVSFLRHPGNGPTVVLLHGIGSNAHSFDGLLGALFTDLDVIAWDAPGYGGSDPLPMEWPQASDYAERLALLLDGLGIESAYLMGHSLGALMATSFAVRWPQRVQGLLLASPALGHGAQHGGALSPATEKRINDLETLGPEAFANARAPGLLYRPDHAPNLSAVESAMAAVSLPGYAQAARMLASGRLLDDAKNLRAPTHVIVGLEDRITPPENARKLHDHLPPRRRRSLTIVPNAGHALTVEAPHAVADAAIEMLSETAETTLLKPALKETGYA